MCTSINDINIPFIVKDELINMTRARDKRDERGLDSCRGLRYSLSHARVMLINSSFTLHYRAQNSPSSLSYHHFYCLYLLHRCSKRHQHL